MDERVFRGFQFLFSADGTITISQPDPATRGDASVQITLDDARALIQCLREAIATSSRRRRATPAYAGLAGATGEIAEHSPSARRRRGMRRTHALAAPPPGALGVMPADVLSLFSEDVIDEAWRRARGRCECQHGTHGHEGPCRKQLMRASQGKETPMGWEACPLDAAGPARADNCRILCCDCHKAARVEGRQEWSG